MILLFFFASGWSALVYQIAWTRAAGLAMGNTTAATGTVVAVFMAGLAAGSAWAGRSGRRLPPLRLYGQLEIAIGLFGVAVPWLFRATGPLHAIAYETPLFPVVRALTSALILLPATVMMGATFPLLVRHAARAEAAGRLYAVNSAGAALGTLVAGLALIPAIGLTSSTLIAAAVNIAVGLAALRMAKSAATPDPSPEAPPAPLDRPRRLALALYAASGFAALVCEMAWTRAITLAVGSTVYAFTLVLFSFILGLAGGSAFAARRAPSLSDPLRVAAILQLGLAGWGAGLVYVLAELPIHAIDLFLSLSRDFVLLQLTEAGVIAALIVPPTLLMGALLPVALAAFRRDDPGRSTGRLYAWNTLASIAGTLAGSFLLIPALGVDLTLRLAAGVNLAAALAAIGGAPAGPRPLKPALLGAAASLLAALVLLPRWETAISASGTFLDPGKLDRVADRDDIPRAEVARKTRIEGNYWDSYGLVVVSRSRSGDLQMTVNGKTDASTVPADMRTQVLSAQIPMTLHPDPRDVMVIGLGSGVTLASAQDFGPATVDCVEISPAVVRAAEHFSAANGGAVRKPGTRLIVGDGRAHARYSTKRYDVVVSEPSNLWIGGMASLFTVECFRDFRARLKPGGLVAQFVHTYRLSQEDFRGVVRTFAEVFPHTFVWEMTYGDYLLLGSVEPRSWRMDQIEERLKRPAVAARLSQAEIKNAAEFLAGLVFIIEGGFEGRRITDDHCWVEYTAPLSMLTGDLQGFVKLFSRRRSAREILVPGSFDEEAGKRLDRLAGARRRLGPAMLAANGTDPPAFRREMDAILEVTPQDRVALRLAEREGETLYQRAFELQAQGEYGTALHGLSGVPVRAGAYARSRALAGWCLVRLGLSAGARTAYQESLASRPKFVDAQVGLAQITEAEGKIDDARKLLEEAVTWEPKGTAARLALARFLWRRGEKEKAVAEVEAVLKEHPRDAEAQKLLREFRGG